MTRARNRLHVSKLEEFAAFCQGRGWLREHTKGYFEVLRMRHPDRQSPLLVHARLTTAAGARPVHYTSWGESDRMMNQFLKENDDAD